MQTKEKPTIFLGKDTTIEELKKAINEGHELGRKIFSQRTSFSSRMDTDDLDEDDLDIDEDSSDDDDDDDGSLEIEDSDTGDMRLEFSQGRRYHLATAVEKFCNEGRSSMAAQTKVRRIRIVDSSRHATTRFLRKGGAKAHFRVLRGNLAKSLTTGRPFLEEVGENFSNKKFEKSW